MRCISLMVHLMSFFWFISWSRIIFEKLMVTELVRKLPSLIPFHVTYYH